MKFSHFLPLLSAANAPDPCSAGWRYWQPSCCLQPYARSSYRCKYNKKYIMKIIEELVLIFYFLHFFVRYKFADRLDKNVIFIIRDVKILHN